MATKWGIPAAEQEGTESRSTGKRWSKQSPRALPRLLHHLCMLGTAPWEQEWAPGGATRGQVALAKSRDTRGPRLPPCWVVFSPGKASGFLINTNGFFGTSTDYCVNTF